MLVCPLILSSCRVCLADAKTVATVRVELGIWTEVTLRYILEVYLPRRRSLSSVFVSYTIDALHDTAPWSN